MKRLRIPKKSVRLKGLGRIKQVWVCEKGIDPKKLTAAKREKQCRLTSVITDQKRRKRK